MLLPFRGLRPSLTTVLEQLLPQLHADVQLVLVDDGSDEDVLGTPNLRPLIDRPEVHVLRHPRNLGVAAARNTGISWCLEHGFDIVVMVDDDCLVPADHVARHLAAHRRHPEAAVVGGAIRGVGGTIWARLDAMMTWFHVLPEAKEGILRAPYSAPTANVSVKIRRLPFKNGFFDTRLRTGEDTAFSRAVRSAGHHLVFVPDAEIGHLDRNSFVDFLSHQYRFGRHHYFLGHIDLGLGDVCFKTWYRLLFLAGFVVVMPLYAFAGCLLNIRPVIAINRRAIVYWPLMQAVWLVKGIAVLEAAARVRSAYQLR